MVWKKESFKLSDAVADKQNGYSHKVRRATAKLRAGDSTGFQCLWDLHSYVIYFSAARIVHLTENHRHGFF